MHTGRLRRLKEMGRRYRIVLALLSGAVSRHAPAEEQPQLVGAVLHAANPRPIQAVTDGLKEAEQQALARRLARARCDVMPIWGDRTGCRTPRPGVVSGGYVALDVGWAAFAPAAAERAGVGMGPAFHVRFGVEFFDQVLAGVGIGSYGLHDKRPFSQLVVSCQMLTNQCSQPSSAETSIATGFVTAEVGYQTRFRPALAISLTPGATLGYLQSFVSLSRSIDCVDCKREVLDLVESGAYVAPFFRVTFDQLGWVAVILRSEWFFTSDIKHMTFLGGEVLLP